MGPLRKRVMNNKTKLAFAWIFLGAMLSFYYTNCESYSSNTMPSGSVVKLTVNDVSNCEENPSSADCLREKAETYNLRKGFINLTIAGSNTIQMNAYDFAVNVSGNCYQDMFQKTEIYFRLVNNAQNLLMLSNNTSRAFLGSNIHCVNGQWGFAININPEEVTYVGTDIKFDKSQSHVLIVEMVVRDENDTLYQNTGMAQDSISFAPSIVNSN